MLLRNGKNPIRRIKTVSEIVIIGTNMIAGVLPNPEIIQISDRLIGNIPLAPIIREERSESLYNPDKYRE